MEQTAVEFLFNKLEFQGTLYLEDFEKAKEMDKEQRGYSEIDLEVAFFEGREHNLTFNQWLEQFKNQKK